jgi:hypothetical protein
MAGTGVGPAGSGPGEVLAALALLAAAGHAFPLAGGEVRRCCYCWERAAVLLAGGPAACTRVPSEAVTLALLADGAEL